ncbi:glycosyltransferase family 2 protein [Mesorhizobium sp. 10J20-29]
MTHQAPYPFTSFTRSPRVAVIVGCYNQAEFVEAAIRSVASQSHVDFECVVIDDVSSDGSRERIRAVLAEMRDDRFRFLERTANGGQMTTMMQGFDATSSPFVAFLDADDVWSRDFIERHVRAHLSRNGIRAISSSDADIIDDTNTIVAGGLPMFRDGDMRQTGRGRKLFHEVQEGGDTLVFVNRLVPKWRWSTTSGMMFRRDAIQAIRPLDTDRIRHCADAYLAPAAHMLGGTVRIEHVLGSYRLHSNNGWAHQRLLGDACRMGLAPEATDKAVRAALAERWCAVAPDLEPLIPRRLMGRLLVNHIGWAEAFELIAANADAHRLLGDWATPMRRRIHRLATCLPRPLRPRILR